MHGQWAHTNLVPRSIVVFWLARKGRAWRNEAIYIHAYDENSLSPSFPIRVSIYQVLYTFQENGEKMSSEHTWIILFLCLMDFWHKSLSPQWVVKDFWGSNQSKKKHHLLVANLSNKITTIYRQSHPVVLVVYFWGTFLSKRDFTGQYHLMFQIDSQASNTGIQQMSCNSTKPNFMHFYRAAPSKITV